MTTIDKAVSVSEISKVFHKPKTVSALTSVTFDVERGTIVGLLGRNGAGKTTLIRIMTTLLYPTSGQVQVGGFDVIHEPQRVREIIGYAGQDTERSLYYRLSPLDNAKYFGWLRGLSAEKSQAKMRDLTARIGMEEQLLRQFITLSGGEKQVFVVLRALLHDPRIAFLDEPSKSLDVITARKIRTLLRELVAEHQMTLVITSHNLQELESLCDTLVLIDRGEVVFDGKPHALKMKALRSDAIEVIGPLTDQCRSQLIALGEATGSQNGNRLRILASKPYTVIKQVVDILEAHHIEAKVQMMEGSIEDAFTEIVTKGK